MASDPFPVGLVVWGKVQGWPWWPAVIVDRQETEPRVRDPRNLALETSRNRMVMFFNDNDSVTVLDRSCLLEYTRNIEKFTEPDRADKPRVVAACQEANTYVFTSGTEAQRREVTRPAFMVLTMWKPPKRVPSEDDVKKEEELVDVQGAGAGSSRPRRKKRRVLEQELQLLNGRVAALEKLVYEKCGKG